MNVKTQYNFPTWILIQVIIPYFILRKSKQAPNEKELQIYKMYKTANLGYFSKNGWDNFIAPNKE